MKCYFCKRDIPKGKEYMWIHTSKTGREYKRYCCSLEEKEQNERDIELYKKCQLETDSILGRAITNNARNKELKEIHEFGYSWEQIYRCIKAKADEIKQMIEYNHIENDYQQIRYMMQVIKNCIYDFSKEDERKNDWNQYAEDTIEEELFEEKEETDDDIVNRLKNKKENKNNISSFLDSLK